MAAAAPPSTASTPSTPAVAVPTPRAGDLRDVGAVRRDSIRASRWTASGTGKVQGDVDVIAGTVAGMFTVGGKLTAQSFTAEGTLEVLGPVEARDALHGRGRLRLENTTHAGAAEIRGTLQCGGDVRVDRDLRVVGLLEAPSIHVGLLDLTGGAQVRGDLDAGSTITARFKADSQFGSVRARAVVLRGPSPGLVPTLLRKVLGGSAAVAVERIEADSVELEAVDVQFVRAKAITLGPGAHVSELEGTIVRRHPTARVGPESRSPPPYGLTR